MKRGVAASPRPRLLVGVLHTEFWCVGSFSGWRCFDVQPLNNYIAYSSTESKPSADQPVHLV